ncbi:hypothetical protein K438DRAFT_1767672 [Mycena galopus ATCC 62051]|nr:hypothetical protein K438DRAFT_1767672 [Mycena galopus ATCC 62051]
MRISIVSSLLAVLCASFTLALEQVLTPGGYRAKTNVFEIPPGGSIVHFGSKVHVLAANGTVAHVADSHPEKAHRPRDLLDGWIAFAWWLNPGLAPISSFRTTWEVPPVPDSDNGQTVFLFNALQPNGSSAILQPVLQYGPSNAGGGSFWAVATWYVDGTGNAFFTTPVPVISGQTLQGVITLTGSDASNSTFTYNAKFTDVPGTSMNLTGAAELTFAAETLEAYGITALSDYPAGSTVFSAVDLTLADGMVPSIAWSAEGDLADGVSITVDTDGRAEAHMTIIY